MRTYIFFREHAVIGVIAMPEGMALTPEQSKKIQDKGITIIIKTASVPQHDGDINRLVDTLVEKDWL